MIARKDVLKQLRIEEGKKLEVGKSGDPLDGTWTRPDPALKKMLFVQQSAGVLVFIALFLILMLFPLFISSELWFLAYVMFPFIIMMGIVALLTKWIVNRIYEKHRFRITDEELIVENGFITTQKILIPLTGVQHVRVMETWWGNRYGLKNVVVDTAGFSYVPNAGIAAWSIGFLQGLRNADEVAEAILSRVKEVKVRAKNGM